MALLTKTSGVSLITLQEMTSAPRQVISTAQDVSTKLAATVFARVGRVNTSSLSAGVQIRVEASSKVSGNGFWYPVATFLTDYVAAAEATPTNTENPGDTVIETSNTTNFAAQDFVFIKNSTFANSEFARVASVSTNTSITLEEGLINTQTNSSRVYDRAESFVAAIDLTAISRLRVVVDGSLTTANFSCEVYMVTGDAIG